MVGKIATNSIIAAKRLHNQSFFKIANKENEIITKSSIAIISFIYQYLFFTIMKKEWF
jgi:hypothetical protein